MKIKPIRIDGDIAYVPLTKGYEAVIDAVDVPLVAGFNWCANKDKHVVYAIRTDLSGVKRRGTSIHRTILGEPAGMCVDHIDRDGLNNRRANLRVATPEQNRHNSKMLCTNTSGLKGVHWRDDQKKWRAQITVAGKKKNLGYFPTKEEAHAAYCKASQELHGEFGRTT